MGSIRPSDSCEEVGGYRRCFVSVKISRAWGGDGLLANRGGGRLLSKIYFPQHFNQTNHKHQALVISFDASHLFHLQKVPSNARDTTVRWDGGFPHSVTTMQLTKWVCLFSTMWSKLCTVSIIHSPIVSWLWLPGSGTNTNIRRHQSPAVWSRFGLSFSL